MASGTDRTEQPTEALDYGPTGAFEPEPAEARSPGAPANPTPPRGPSPGSYERGFGIRTKIFLAIAALLVFTLGAVISLAAWRANAGADETIRAALAPVRNIFENYRATLQAQHVDRLQAIAASPGTKALFAGADVETRWDWARDVARAQGARTVFLFDATSAAMAISDREVGRDLGRPFGAVPWVGGVLDTELPRAAAIREREVLSLVAAVPVLSGEGRERILNGVLAASFALGSAAAADLARLTRGEVAFLLDVAARGEAARHVVVAATSDFRPDAFLEALERQPGALERILKPSGSVVPLDLEVGGERRLVAGVPLLSASGEPLGAFVASRSLDAEIAVFAEIRNTALVAGAIALLIAMPLSLAIGRGFARPIEKLAASAEAIGEGNLDVEIPRGGRDEIGALARAFGAMVEELQEKAALESLLQHVDRAEGAATPAVESARPSAKPGASRTGPRIGDVVAGRYEILEAIGRGGMATVFRALDRELEEEVALKVLHADGERGQPSFASIKREIRLARQITHRNVVRTHDLGEADGVRFLTMELVPGMTLRELLDRRGALAWAPGSQIAKQLCRGLAAVHEAGIVHRDLKPLNVMVLPNGLVKLMDFGISSETTAGVAGRVDKVVGTPQYMSPEQGEGEPLDFRSDLYALGTLMFEIFTGSRPFDGRDARTILADRRTKDAPSPRSLRPDLPEALETLVLRCLARDPASRPASTAEVYRVLLDL